MSIFLLTESISDVKAKVTLQHFKPEILSPSILSQGIEVDSIPEAETNESTNPVLYINPQTKEMWYEYEDVQIDEMTALKNRLAVQEQKIVEQDKAILELTQLLAGGVA